MSPEVLAMTGELADEIERNSRADEPDLDAPRSAIVDPRTRPVRFHNLRAMAQSAAHAWQSFQIDKSDSLDRRLGAGAHAMLLGKPWVVWDKPSEASTKARAKAEKLGKPLPRLSAAPRSGDAWKAFASDNAGAVILTPRERDAAERLAEAIRRNDLADLLMFSPGCRHEDTILWEQDGRARRTTPDVWAPTVVVEVKTARCVAPRRFRRDVRELAYHAQIADQVNAVEAHTGRRPEEAYIVAVEKVAPFVVEVYRLTKRDIELGDRLCRNWLTQLLFAEQRNAWSSYSTGVIDLDLPEDDYDLKPVTEDEEEMAA